MWFWELGVRIGFVWINWVFVFMLIVIVKYFVLCGGWGVVGGMN